LIFIISLNFSVGQIKQKIIIINTTIHHWHHRHYTLYWSFISYHYWYFFVLMPLWLVYKEICVADVLTPSFIICVSKYHHHHHHLQGTSKQGAVFDIGLLGLKFKYFLKLTHEPKYNTLTWTLDYTKNSDFGKSIFTLYIYTSRYIIRSDFLWFIAFLIKYEIYQLFVFFFGMEFFMLYLLLSEIKYHYSNNNTDSMY
jgi:hypothetical protein